MRGGVETRYIYDVNGNLLAEADANNTITRYYIHGAGLLAAITPANDLYCYHYDVTGNTVAITDGSENVVNSYDYSPFGMIISESENFAQPFKYVGKLGVMAEANGFYYMRARYYDPVNGRFISEDPLGFDGGDVNLYVYVQNNPINFTDPFGLWTVSVGVNVNTALGFGGGGGTSVNFGYSKKDGLSSSLSGTAQGGAIAGGGAFAGGSITITDADNVNQLNGTSYQVGRSGIGPAYGEGVMGNGYTGATLGIGLGVGYTAGSVTADTTSAIFQYNNGVYSVGNTGTSSVWSSSDK